MIVAGVGSDVVAAGADRFADARAGRIRDAALDGVSRAQGRWRTQRQDAAGWQAACDGCDDHRFAARAMHRFSDADAAPPILKGAQVVRATDISVCITIRDHAHADLARSRRTSGSASSQIRFQRDNVVRWQAAPQKCSNIGSISRRVAGLSQSGLTQKCNPGRGRPLIEAGSKPVKGFHV